MLCLLVSWTSVSWKIISTPFVDYQGCLLCGYNLAYYIYFKNQYLKFWWLHVQLFFWDDFHIQKNWWIQVYNIKICTTSHINIISFNHIGEKNKLLNNTIFNNTCLSCFTFEVLICWLYLTKASWELILNGYNGQEIKLGLNG